MSNQLENLKDENEKLKADLAKAQAKPAHPPLFASPQAVDLDEYKDGKFIRKGSDGKEVFFLKIVADDELKRTHKLKSVEHFAEMTEDAFRADFDKA